MAPMITVLRRLLAFAFLGLGLVAGLLGLAWGGAALPLWYETIQGVVVSAETERHGAVYLPRGISRGAFVLYLEEHEIPFVYRPPPGLEVVDPGQIPRPGEAVDLTYRYAGRTLCDPMRIDRWASRVPASGEVVREALFLACDLLVGPPQAIMRLEVGTREPVSFLDTAVPDALVFLFLFWGFVVFTRLGGRGLAADDLAENGTA
jgi:hypothetical protein